MDVFPFYSKTVFSNFYYAPFTIDGVDYHCVEQCMMFGKASLFNDSKTADKILKEKNPARIKKLGREVKDFCPYTWDDYKIKIVKQACYEKFYQNPELRKELLKTQGQLLVEAATNDYVWGAGLDEKQVLDKGLQKYPGHNLLGQILTCVRAALSSANSSGKALLSCFGSDCSAYSLDQPGIFQKVYFNYQDADRFSVISRLGQTSLHTPATPLFNCILRHNNGKILFSNTMMFFGFSSILKTPDKNTEEVINLLIKSYGISKENVYAQ